jgi:VanZ family protein
MSPTSVRAAGSGGVERRWLVAALAFASAIMFVSSRPYLHAPGPEFELKDNLAHALEYAVLAALLWRALVPLVWPDRWIAFGLIVAIAASVGAADEMFQGSIPGRRRDVVDWMSDGTGAVVASAICAGLAGRSRRAPTSAGPR